MTFKVGDKVKCVRDTNTRAKIKLGEVYEVVEVKYPYQGSCQHINLKGVATNYDFGLQSLRFELVEEEWSDWMHEKDAIAFLGVKGLCQATLRKSWYEYRYRMNDEYRFPMSRKAKPVVETRVLTGINKVFNGLRSDYDTHRITFNTIDGEIDCSSVKMEKL